jgi:hypothetical protein
MLNYGIPVLFVSKRLGHSKPSLNLDVYGHLLPSKQEEAANLMDHLMTQATLPIARKLHEKSQERQSTFLSILIS